MTALWFWDVGGIGIKGEFKGHRSPVMVNVIACYTCGATFACLIGVSPQCPVCKSRGTCDSMPPITNAFNIQVYAGYVRDDDAPLPSAQGSQGF